MSISDLTTNGRGSLRYRLMIEGWPEMFVTDPSLTCTSIADGRTVIAGLLYESLQVHDRIIPAEAKISASGNTFKIRPPYGSDTTDPVLASLSQYPEPVAALGEDFPFVDSSLVLKGGSLSNTTVYHMGTEAFRVGTFPTISARTVWDTQLQSHRISYFDTTKAVYIYERPPTMEGRRCYLYAYGEGDAGTGSGTLWWRGIVHRAPKLDGDCVTWLIEALPITAILQQKVAGDTTETHPVGIYHHNTCTFGFYFEVPGQRTQIYRYPSNSVGADPDEGLDTEQTLIEAVNALIAQAISDNSITIVESITLVKDAASGGKFSFALRMGVAPDPFRIVGGSPLLGWCDTYHFGWFARSGDGSDDIGVTGWSDLAANTTYMAPLEYHEEGYKFPGNTYAYDGGGVAAPLGHAGAIFKMGPPTDGFNPGELFRHNLVGGGIDQYPAWRLHTDIDISNATMVHVEGSISESGNFAADAIGGTTAKTIAGETANFNWIILDQVTETWPPGAWDDPLLHYSRQVGFYGILLAGSSVVPIRKYGVGSVTTFVGQLKSNGVEANQGDTPFITSADLTTWDLLGDASVSWRLRQYAFTRPKALEELLAEECKMAGHLMRIESDGRIGIIPLPLVTDVAPVESTHQISGDDIITPAGSLGAWPQVEPQRDGFITQVSIQEKYNAIADDWSDPPYTFQDPDAIATHKNRGKGIMTIRPYSRLAVADDPAYLKLLASRILSFFSRDYLVVTVKVPFTKFNVLCGDTVSLTHRLIPDGQGSRGIISRRGVVIERRWNLDPRVEEFGTLTIWINGAPLSGYAPGGQVTAQADQGGNVWLITIDSANDFNIQISTNGDGNILEHFQVGDAVRVVEADSTSPTTLDGTVEAVSVDDDQITVDFTGTWTPGSSTWYLEFGTHDLCEVGQLKYAFAADSDMALSDGSFARRLS